MASVASTKAGAEPASIEVFVTKSASTEESNTNRCVTGRADYSWTSIEVGLTKELHRAWSEVGEDVGHARGNSGGTRASYAGCERDVALAGWN